MKESKTDYSEYFDKDLLLFTNTYPEGPGERFIESELNYLSKRLKKIIILPIEYGQDSMSLQSNILVSKAKTVMPVLKFFKSYFLLFLKFYIAEILQDKRVLLLLLNFRRYLSLFRSAAGLADYLMRGYGESLSKKIFYCYWMNSWALSLSILKARGAIKNFYFRVHGYDLYEYRSKDHLIPYKYVNYQFVDRIFPVSQDGCDYLISKGVDQEKVKLSRLGIGDLGTNPFAINSEFVMVSCSSLIPLKRVHLIVEALSRIDFKMKWIHFGDGPEMGKVRNALENLKQNIQVDLNGDVDHSEVLSYYRNFPVNLFINVSQFEGLPYSIIEVISFGIPVLATDVGGSKEIVNHETGILVDKHISAGELAKKITEFKTGNRNGEDFRRKVKLFWRKEFNADVNYRNIYQELTS